jgi:hypothetical protein
MADKSTVGTRKQGFIITGISSFLWDNHPCRKPWNFRLLSVASEPASPSIAKRSRFYDSLERNRKSLSQLTALTVAF